MTISNRLLSKTAAFWQWLSPSRCKSYSLPTESVQKAFSISPSLKGRSNYRGGLALQQLRPRGMRSEQLLLRCLGPRCLSRSELEPSSKIGSGKQAGIMTKLDTGSFNRPGVTIIKELLKLSVKIFWIGLVSI